MEDLFEKEMFSMASEEKMILPKELDTAIDRILCKKKKVRLFGRMNFRKTVVLAAVLIMLLSTTAVAAVGVVRERMEALKHEQIENYFAQIYASKIPADNYARPFTEGEKARLKELGAAYEKEARFPKGELTVISTVAEYRGKGVALYPDTGTFFFPNEEMSDEELLQIIDFRCKRDYSLQKMNEMIAAGEAELPTEILDQSVEETAVFASDTELTFFYEGDLELQYMYAGQNSIFLAGWDAVHRMEIGSPKSTLFYADFEKKTRITALYQDEKMNVYLGLMEKLGENKWDYRILILDGEGRKQGGFQMPKGYGMIRSLIVDPQGRIYVRAFGMEQKGHVLTVFDQDGRELSPITSPEYRAPDLGGLCIGKDGRIYTVIREAEGNAMGIASIDTEKGCLLKCYTGIVPEDTIMLDLIAPGSDTDFVFWGYDGIFTYNLEEEQAVNILPAYKAPCNYEGVLCLALPDGRIVFADRTEYRVETNENGVEEIFAIPEKVRFYYTSASR